MAILRISADEPVSAKLGIWNIAFQDVVGGNEDGVANCYSGFSMAPTATEPVALGREVSVLYPKMQPLRIQPVPSSATWIHGGSFIF